MALSLSIIAWVVWVIISSALLQEGTGSPLDSTALPGEGTTTPRVEEKPKLLFILLGGFRWNYLDKQRREDLPGFDRFLQSGIRARWTEPVFPTLSFPAWTTLTTGLYTENHGIVGNYFYDPETQDVFSLSDLDTTAKAKWWTAEPIWTTAEKANLRTAQYLFSRCDVPFDGVVTDKCEPFTDDLRRDSLLRYIMRAAEDFEKGYDFIQIYTGHVDDIGHIHGPDSEEVRREVRKVDTAIGILLDELEDRNLLDKVNVVIVSDHGMADTSEGAVRVQDIKSYLRLDDVESIADYGAFMNIKTKEHFSNHVYESLRDIPGVTAFKKEGIPELFHFKNGKYVHDIVLIAQAGHYILPLSSEKQLPEVDRFMTPIGAHGYALDVPDMRGVFFARGPAFLEGITIEPIRMVDVYQVLTNVLDIVPLPHNGTWRHVAPAFRASHRYPKYPNNASVSIASCIWTAIFVLLTRYL